MQKHAEALHQWFLKNQRPLPWRANRKPYPIWISEIMLQQTTTTAVIPFFEKFMKRFPNVKSLAQAPESEVVKHWAGLGYYSRARNIHKAAQAIHKLKKFPQTYIELLALPGIGPYASRAISSQAFNEKVGVVDGNVIRLLTRHFALDLDWWNRAGQTQLQSLADQMVQHHNPSDINQAMMELGSTICTPKNPKCLLCPWTSSCLSKTPESISTRPRPKPKRSKEIWVWDVDLNLKRNKVAFIKNNYAPFLKGHWLLPGKAKLVQQKLKTYDLRHSVTHHDIYIRINKNPSKTEKFLSKEILWLPRDSYKETAPASVIEKILQYI